MQVRTLSTMAALGGSLLLGAHATAGGPADGSAPDFVAPFLGEMISGAAWFTDIPGFGAANVWRIYANVGVGNQVTAVFGDMGDPLSITTFGGVFYQDPLGGDAEPSQAFVDLFPDTLGNDSYVTIGNPATDPGETTTGLSPFFPSGSAGGDPWGTGPLETMNGSWFRTPDDPLTFANADGQVLIAQLTVADGAAVDGILNLAWVIGGQSGTSLETFVIFPSPSVLGLLGLAGLAGPRRRRC